MSASISSMDYAGGPQVEQLVAALREDLEGVRRSVQTLAAMLPSRTDRKIEGTSAPAGANSTVQRGLPGQRFFDESILSYPMLISPALGSRTAIVVEVQTRDAENTRGEVSHTVIEVADLLSGLNGQEPKYPPVIHRVAGGFFPSVLMYEGWWTKTGAAAWGHTPADPNPVDDFRVIQSWLNRGFEQWGPSWNLIAPERKEADLFGQLGYGDEANSIPVIIGPDKAKRVLDALDRRLVVQAEVQGTLCHRDQITSQFIGRSKEIATQLAAARPKFDYFLVVQDENPSHEVEPLTDRPSLYSAYLWQCLVRKEDEKHALSGTLPLSEAIFVWEHTNLTDASSVMFNFDSLMHKKRYLERLVGPLTVLHHSYPIDHFAPAGKVEALIPIATMLALFARAGDLLSHSSA